MNRWTLWGLVCLNSVQLLMAEPSIDISTVHKGKRPNKAKTEQVHHHSFMHKKDFHHNEELSETSKDHGRKIHEHIKDDGRVADSTAYKSNKKDVHTKDISTEKKNEEPKAERVKKRRNEITEREGEKWNNAERKEDSSAEKPNSERVEARKERKSGMKEDYLSSQEESRNDNHEDDYEIDESHLSNPKSEKVRGQKEVEEEKTNDKAMHQKVYELKGKKINREKRPNKDNEGLIDKEEYPKSDKVKQVMNKKVLDDDDSEETGSKKSEPPLESSVPSQILSHIPSWESTNAAKNENEFVTEKPIIEEDANSGSSESKEKSINADAVKAEEENIHKSVGQLMLILIDHRLLISLGQT